LRDALRNGKLALSFWRSDQIGHRDVQRVCDALEDIEGGVCTSDAVLELRDVSFGDSNSFS
jgi:hypothetical protein